MVKPKIFVSSTIYDFRDLRSALKYWLEEFGYEVLMSECCDFDKDSSKNSYDACLQAIKACDYFVLLIGGRVGGWYDKEVSITRKEYQTAYDSAREGQVKRIVSFVRQSIWDVLEDRQALLKTLKDLDIQENGQPVAKEQLAYHDSKVVKDANHIKAFLEEVTRKREFNSNEKPSFNWVNSFNSFQDIVSVLKIELNLRTDLLARVAEINIKRALARNLREITEKTEDGKIVGTFLGYGAIRSKLMEERQHVIKNLDNVRQQQIYLTKAENRSLGESALFYFVGVDALDTFIFENTVNMGTFCKYHKEKEAFVESGLSKALYHMVYYIKKLQRSVSSIDKKSIDEIIALQERYGWEREENCFSFYDVSTFLPIYECKYNILELTHYIFACFEAQMDSLPYPNLLHGIVAMGNPSEDEIIEIMELPKS